jgi:hypothetical protein
MLCVMDRLVKQRGTKKAHCEEKSAKPYPRGVYVPWDGTLDPMCDSGGACCLLSVVSLPKQVCLPDYKVTAQDTGVSHSRDMPLSKQKGG